MRSAERILEDIYLIDTMQFGISGYGAAYLLRGSAPALVDCGTSLAKDDLLAGIHSAGISPHEIRWLFLTHVHPDHAGGAGFLLPHLPRATVVVHAQGAHHLAKPERLSASARKATGAMAHHYGTFSPIRPKRLHGAEDGEEFSLGDGLIRAVDSPGHAPHHLCFLEEGSEALFTGDAVGLWRKGRLLPATVPPQFDLESSLQTLERLQALAPRHLLFTHFGHCANAQELLKDYAHLLPTWVQRVERALDEEGDEDAALHRLMAEPDLQALPFNETDPQGELAMSIRGVLIYLRQARRGDR